MYSQKAQIKRIRNPHRCDKNIEKFGIQVRRPMDLINCDSQGHVDIEMSSSTSSYLGVYDKLRKDLSIVRGRLQKNQKRKSAINMLVEGE